MSSIKVYSIPFSGFYPVGAVAVVFAATPLEAASALYCSAEFAPHRSSNNIIDMSAGAKLLQSSTPVHILLDGEY